MRTVSSSRTIRGGNNESLHLAPKILISLASCPMEKEDLKTPNME
jgi:hypothetical protein